METMNVKARRTGGRSANVMTSIRRAVEELIKEVGTERITIPVIAERAGVNPTSIYRRWEDLPTLIFSKGVALNLLPLQILQTGKLKRK